MVRGITRRCSRLLAFVVLCWTCFLCQTSSHLLGRRVVLIAGNFTLDGEKLNVAQYDLQSKTWSKDYQSQLFQYGEDNAVIWDVAINRSASNTVYDKLFTVGLFDTVSSTSQIQLCSVARFDGLSFEKVGEGLCARGDISEIVIQTIVLGSNGDLFVGGAFDTRVWDGHHFVYVYHVARFNAKTASWLPLDNGGELKCSNGESSRVNTLAWDADDGVLFMGGNFDTIDERRISSSIAIWTQQNGVQDFPGGSLTGIMNNQFQSSEVKDLIYDAQSGSLYVSGTFSHVNGSLCPGIAVWSKECNSWTCLYDVAYSFESVTSIAYDRESNYLYLTGLVNTASSWNFSASSSYFTHLSEAHHHHQYSIARLQMKGYNHYCHVNSNTRRKLHITQSKLRHRRTSTVQSGIQYNHNRRLAGQKKSNDSSTTNSTILNRPWTLTWEWLPGFSAYPSPIQRLTPGTKDLKGSLFIAAYTDMTDEISPVSSLLLWTPPQNHEDSYNLTVLGGNDHKIRGLVSSVLVDLSLPYSPTDSRKDQDDDITHHKYPDNPILPPHDLNRDTDYTFLILFACVGLGILLGLSFTVSCFYRSQEEANINNITLANYRGKEDSGQSSGGISLRTLSDGYGNAMDFKECFERAMKTRHLSTYETLIMINPKEIMLNRIIGEGSFGRVWSGQWRHNKVAVKEFIFAQAAIAGGMTLQRNNIIEEIVGEAGVMACLRHPKILQLYGCSLTMQAIWIVSELCVKGSLKMLLMAGPVPAIPSINHGSNSLKPIQIEDPEASLGLMNSPMEGVELSVLQKLSILMDIADGMQYLHQRNPPIIHRDLKSHNIFITETTPGNYIAKIGDWGSARAIALTNSKSMTQGVGTACWLSPEVINNAHFSKASDVYAFGIILWEVHTRQEIYEGLSAAQIIAKVAHEELRPSVPRNCPWAKLMTQCWKQDPAQRPNFDTILKVLSSLHLKYTARINHNRQQHLFQQSEQATTPVAVKQQGHIEYFQSPSIDITEGNSYLASKSNESPYNTGTSAGSSKNGSGGMVKRSSLRSAPSVMELSYLVSTSYTSNTPIHSNLMSYETMDAGSKGSKNNSSSNNSPLGRPPQSSTAATFASTIINSTTSDGTIASASQLRSSPTRQSQRSNPVANINASAGNHRSPAQYGYNSSTQNPSLLTAFDSFHPSLENIQFYESPLIGNNGSGKGEPSTYHLAPEIVSAQLSVLVEEEPPDPLDFLFQESTPLNGSSSSSNKSKFK